MPKLLKNRPGANWLSWSGLSRWGSRAGTWTWVRGQTIQFNPEADIWIDTAVVSQLLEMPTTNLSEDDRLKKALTLYRGDFLEGFSLGDSAAFEEWLLVKREYFRRLAIQTLQQLTDRYEHNGHYTAALEYGWRLVDLEPWREKTHRQLMRLLALTGQRGAALAQHETCRRLLSEELGVEPSAETTRLYQQIRGGAFGPSPHEVGQARFPSSDPASLKPIPPVPKMPATGRLEIGRWFWILGGLLMILIIVGASIWLAFAKNGEVIAFQDEF